MTDPTFSLADRIAVLDNLPPSHRGKFISRVYGWSIAVTLTSIIPMSSFMFKSAEGGSFTPLLIFFGWFIFVYWYCDKGVEKLDQALVRYFAKRLEINSQDHWKELCQAAANNWIMTKLFWSVNDSVLLEKALEAKSFVTRLEDKVISSAFRQVLESNLKESVEKRRSRLEKETREQLESMQELEAIL